MAQRPRKWKSKKKFWFVVRDEAGHFFGCAANLEGARIAREMMNASYGPLKITYERKPEYDDEPVEVLEVE